MSAHNVLETAKQRGIHLKAKGHELRFNAPPGAMDDEFVRQIKKNKAHLLLLLDASVPVWCGTTCPKGEKRQINDLPVLWCTESAQIVYDMQACPLGHWIKDSAGRPVDQEFSYGSE